MHSDEAEMARAMLGGDFGSFGGKLSDVEMREGRRSQSIYIAKEILAGQNVDLVIEGAKKIETYLKGGEIE